MPALIEAVTGPSLCLSNVVFHLLHALLLGKSSRWLGMECATTLKRAHMGKIEHFAQEAPSARVHDIMCVSGGHGHYGIGEDHAALRKKWKELVKCRETRGLKVGTQAFK